MWIGERMTEQKMHGKQPSHQVWSGSTPLRRDSKESFPGWMTDQGDLEMREEKGGKITVTIELISEIFHKTGYIGYLWINYTPSK